MQSTKPDGAADGKNRGNGEHDSPVGEVGEHAGESGGTGGSDGDRCHEIGQGRLSMRLVDGIPDIGHGRGNDGPIERTG